MIRELIDSNDYIIVLDTNVLLHIYRVSPDYSEFALNCLNTVSCHVMLPSIVWLECSSQFQSSFAKAQRRVEQTIQEPISLLQDTKQKILDSCDHLEQLHYPEIDILKNRVDDKLIEISSIMKDFFSEHSQWVQASNSWGNTDLVADLVKGWNRQKQVHKAFTQEELYKLCDEGEKRFERKRPPGFEDAKKKAGIRKYADFLIWKETMLIAKETQKNIIFVTNDMKKDWWEKDHDKNTVFHNQLVAEFSDETSLDIHPFSAVEFFEEIAKDYSIQKPAMLELALHANFYRIAKTVADDVFSLIEEDLFYSNREFIDDRDVGTEGIDELFIDNYEFISAEESSDAIGEYIFSYNVTLSGTSYDYWGKDDDTKEIILSPGIIHTFKGIIRVAVSREINDTMDVDDFVIEKASIMEGDLKQISAVNMFDNE